MHLVQAVTFSPVGRVADCKLGYCFLLQVGLYFVARRRTLTQAIFPAFPHILQTFDMFLITDDKSLIDN